MDTISACKLVDEESAAEGLAIRDSFSNSAAGKQIAGDPPVMHDLDEFMDVDPLNQLDQHTGNLTFLPNFLTSVLKCH